MRIFFTKTGIVYLIAVLYAVPAVSYAAGPQNLVDLGNMLADILNAGATFLVLAALIILFGNIMRRIVEKLGLGGGDTKMSRTILWGVATIFVMVSIWGIIKVLQNTLFNTGSSAPNTSRSSPLDFTLPIIN